MINNITPFNDKKQAHGYWEMYNYNGELWYKCFFQNGEIVGYEEFKHFNGKLYEKKYHV